MPFAYQTKSKPEAARQPFKTATRSAYAEMFPAAAPPDHNHRQCACGGGCPRCREHLAGLPPAGAVQPQAPPTASTNCLTPANPTGKTQKLSPMFAYSQVTAPCLACPNSNPSACPKLGDKRIQPVNTGPVAFSWQEKFLNVGAPHKTHVIQK